MTQHWRWQLLFLLRHGMGSTLCCKAGLQTSNGPDLGHAQPCASPHSAAHNIPFCRHWLQSEHDPHTGRAVHGHSVCAWPVHQQRPADRGPRASGCSHGSSARWGDCAPAPAPAPAPPCRDWCCMLHGEPHACRQHDIASAPNHAPQGHCLRSLHSGPVMSCNMAIELIFSGNTQHWCMWCVQG